MIRLRPFIDAAKKAGIIDDLKAQNDGLDTRASYPRLALDIEGMARRSTYRSLSSLALMNRIERYLVRWMIIYSMY